MERTKPLDLKHAWLGNDTSDLHERRASTSFFSTSATLSLVESGLRHGFVPSGVGTAGGVTWGFELNVGKQA
jgi:hypothetical protein